MGQSLDNYLATLCSLKEDKIKVRYLTKKPFIFLFSFFLSLHFITVQCPKLPPTSTVALLHQSFTCTAFLPLLEQESLFFMELQQTKICYENHVARQNCISLIQQKRFSHSDKIQNLEQYNIGTQKRLKINDMLYLLKINKSRTGRNRLETNSKVAVNSSICNQLSSFRFLNLACSIKLQFINIELVFLH